MRAALLALLVGSAPLRVAAETPPVARAWPEGGLYAGAGAGASPDAAAPSVTGVIVLDRPLWRAVGILVAGDATVVAGGPEDHFALRIAFGPRVRLIESADGTFRALVALAFVHMHEAALSVWHADPFGSFFGESSGGLGHRSGLGGEVDLVFHP